MDHPMEMKALPGWVDPVAMVFLELAILAAIAVAYDIYGRGYRQRVRSMEAVWALSALWLGPFALPLYARTGRPRSGKWQAEHPAGGELGRTAAAASGGRTVGAALLVATVTVLAFDLGMGGWMLVLHFNELMPPVSSVNFLLLMQIGIVLGFLTGFPAVALLLKRGTKVAV